VGVFPSPWLFLLRAGCFSFVRGFAVVCVRFRPSPSFAPAAAASAVARFAASFPGRGLVVVRRSVRSFSGWVAVCAFRAPVASAFALAAARRFGLPFCAVRASFRFGWFRVSVPCFPPAGRAVSLRLRRCGALSLRLRRVARRGCLGLRPVGLLPAAVAAVFSAARAVAFSGSRSPGGLLPVAVFSAAAAAVPASAAVAVGCARGVDAVARGFFPGARVFSVASGLFGSGRGAFAARSVACVRSVAVPWGVFVSFPCRPCPAGLLPGSSSRAFCGSGSGSWASLAFALGLGLRCVVWLPAGVCAPVGWGLSAAGGGWWLSAAAGAAVQLSLF